MYNVNDILKFIYCLIALAYLYIMYYWTDDRASQFIMFKTRVIRNIFIFFGFDHNWKMFGNPSGFNTNFSLLIRWDDGSYTQLPIFSTPSKSRHYYFIDPEKTEDNHYVVKYIDNLIIHNNVKAMFGEFIKRMLEKSETDKKIVRIMMMKNIYSLPDIENRHTPLDPKNPIFKVKEKYQDIYPEVTLEAKLK